MNNSHLLIFSLVHCLFLSKFVYFDFLAVAFEMNRQTKINALNKINEKELELGISGDTKKSWHQVYNDSAWVYIGGLDYDLNEGDILSVFSQYVYFIVLNV